MFASFLTGVGGIWSDTGGSQCRIGEGTHLGAWIENECCDASRLEHDEAQVVVLRAGLLDVLRQPVGKNKNFRKMRSNWLKRK